MKASIITLQSVYNYGTQLQAYASQKKLKEYFDKVEFINYKRPDTYGNGLIKTFSNGSPIRYLAFLPTYFKWRKLFPAFQKKYLHISKKEYKTDSDFNNFKDDSDAYFSGSDQVWNTGWNNGIIPQFYLEFVPGDKPKFAYSSSFGKDKLAASEISKVKQLLSRYDKISVREKSGLDIINKQLELQNAIQLNDPTLAYDGNFWRKLKTKNNIKEKYILVYNLNNNPDFDNYAKEVSRRTGLKLYRFCNRYDQIRKPGKSLLIPKIEDFITYIDDAELVLTDSFHAVAFSANLNTRFIALPPKKYSARLTDFIASIKADGCIAKNYDDYSTLKYNFNFSEINRILACERQRYDAFFKDVMEIIKNGR